MSSTRSTFRPINDLSKVEQLSRLSRDDRRKMRLVSQVLPFRTNRYVIEQLIDWTSVPDDPIFQLTFPQPGMLSDDHQERLREAIDRGDSKLEVQRVVNEIRLELNPHPSGQLEHNVPSLDGERVPGVQHKYRETCLVFPSAGQTCHAYCTFCFRWAQFVGIDELKLATDESQRFSKYLRHHPEVTDVLFTGGDPMVMKTEVLARYVEPLLAPEYEHIQTIRFGSKAISYWPYRFVSQNDAVSLLRLFERIVAAGKHVALMAHVNHGRELSTPLARTAIQRIQSSGATIRTQSPLIRHVNDKASTWRAMWQEQVRLGCVPYYMFVERQTGAKQYFGVPLSEAVGIYKTAIRDLSGLARTVRGPIMSALPGKVMLNGVADVGEKKLFSLSFVQARNPDWCNRPFFAEYDERATWLSDLRPAFGASEHFYERDLVERLSPLSTAAN